MCLFHHENWSSVTPHCRCGECHPSIQNNLLVKDFLLSTVERSKQIVLTWMIFLITKKWSKQKVDYVKHSFITRDKMFVIISKVIELRLVKCHTVHEIVMYPLWWVSMTFKNIIINDDLGQIPEIYSLESFKI